MRADITDRFYKVFTYQNVDRPPDIEFGYWPQTIRRWIAEGMPLELTKSETNDMFCRKLDDFFQFICCQHKFFPLRYVSFQFVYRSATPLLERNRYLRSVTLFLISTCPFWRGVTRTAGTHCVCGSASNIKVIRSFGRFGL